MRIYLAVDIYAAAQHKVFVLYDTCLSLGFHSGDIICEIKYDLFWVMQEHTTSP